MYLEVNIDRYDVDNWYVKPKPKYTIIEYQLW